MLQIETWKVHELSGEGKKSRPPAEQVSPLRRTVYWAAPRFLRRTADAEPSEEDGRDFHETMTMRAMVCLSPLLELNDVRPPMEHSRAGRPGLGC